MAEFPSVGARARFTPNPKWFALRDYGGRTCKVVEPCPPLSEFDYRVLFDGETYPRAVLASELSPLPAAPNSQSAPSSSNSRTSASPQENAET